MNIQTPKDLNGHASPTALHGTNEAMTSEKATDVAMQDTLLTPRFYTTDFNELDAINVENVRHDWDTLIGQMEADQTKAISRKMLIGTPSIGTAWNLLCVPNLSTF